MSIYISETRLSRQRQVTTLSVYNETVEEVVENAEYRVKFTVNSIPVTLEVKLPPEFPECPPVIFCSPPLLHPLITKGAIVHLSILTLPLFMLIITSSSLQILSENI